MIDSNETALLFSLIKSGELRPFKQFIELSGASLECKYISGYTPLMEAVYLENDEFVKYICTSLKGKYSKDREKYKKYLNSSSSDGKTALIIATLGNTKRTIIEYLLKEGASPTLKDLHGKMAKDYAPYATCDDIEKFWSGL